ncbi:phage tail tape measure protein [Corynebacterium aquilae]|uniref:Phage tail tape measure protein domain-containing protein n=1 Tax=Corynebacterium aquilae DSM 44791 TaxID=1431546 RepID=A0A1L7CHH5_9CORY|nr:phage tail tape measure protein [Corynebacterium aquilae]APT85317.1 hypothetical protein CAQU_09840 [Corynebacterium aquilae DSM 44791]
METDSYFVSILPDFKNFFGKLDSTAKKAGADAGKTLGDSLAAAVEKSSKAVESASKRIEVARDKEKNLADKVRVAQIKLNEVLEKENATATQVAKAKADLAKAQRDHKRATNDTERASKSLATRQNELKVAQQQANEAFKTGEKNLDSYSSKADGVAGSIAGIAKKAGGIGLAFAGLTGVGGFMSGAISNGMELDKVMGSLKAVTGSSAETMKQVSDRAKQLGQDTELAGTSAASATDAMLALAKGGMSVEESMDAAKGSIQLAGAAQIDAGQAAELQIAAINAFGLSAGDAAHIADVLTNTANSAATDVTDLGEALKYGAPMAASLGVSLEDTNTMLGIFANNGLKGSGAGTTLAAAMTAMANPSDAAAKAFKELGVEAFDAQGKFKGFADVSEQLKDAQGRMSEQAFTAAAQTAFGAQGLKFATAAAAGGADAFNELRGAMDKQGSAGETAAAGLAGLNGAMDRMGNAIAAAQQALYEWLAPTVTQGIDKFAVIVGELPKHLETVRAKLAENKDLLTVLAGAAGGVAASYAAIKTAQAGMFIAGKLKTMVTLFKAWRLGTLQQTAAQMGLNTAMFANPMGAIVLAIGAVVGAIAVFVTKTETGRKMWESFTGAFSGVGDFFAGIGSAIAGVWDSITSVDLSSFFAWFTPDAHPEIMGFMLNVRDTFVAVKDSIAGGFEWLKDKLAAAWGLIRDGVVFAFKTEIEGLRIIFEAVTSALGFAWDKLTGALQSGYNIVRDAVLWAWNKEVEGWRIIFEKATSFVSDTWSKLTSALEAGYNFVRDAVLWAWNKEVEGWRIIWDSVTSAISGTWDWLKNQLHSGYEWIKTNVFDSLAIALDVVKSAFGTAVDGITSLWDKVRAAAAKPIKFVIDQVFNNGIVAAWNKVAGWVGLDEVQAYTPGWLGSFHTGGVLPGYTPGRDPYTFVEPRTGMTIGLSGGEAVIRPEATRVLGSHWVDGVNAAARMGGVEGVRKHLGGYANGGVVDSIVGVVNRYFPMMTITDTYRPGANDYHGAGLAVDFSNGGDAGTPEMKQAAQFMFENYGKGLLELIHHPFPHNVKHGRDEGDGMGWYKYPLMMEHRNHVHIASAAPLGDPTTMVEQLKGFIGGVFVSLRQRVAEAVGGLLDPIGEKIPNFGGLIGGLPRAAFDKMKDAVVTFLGGQADKYQPAGGVSGNAESWRDMAIAAMRRNGFDADNPAQVNAMIAQIQSESAGIPNRAQEIVDINGTGPSAGMGLLQIIPGTFADHRDPTLPNDRTDPWANMNAALRYYKWRYGSDLTTMWGHGHGYSRGGVIDLVKAGIAKLYDSGGWLPHNGIAVNQSGEPEPVFTGGQWRKLGRITDLIDAIHEVVVAFRGGDWGYGALEEVLNNSYLARRVVDIADVLGTNGIAEAVEEIAVAYRGGDWGYGRLEQILDDGELARRVVNLADSFGNGDVAAAIVEIKTALEDRDGGYAALANVLEDDKLAEHIVNRAGGLSLKNLEAALEEVKVAFKGGDFGYAALSDALDDSRLAQRVVTIADVLGNGGIEVALGEIRDAFDGKDSGFARLADVLGDDQLAKNVVNRAYGFSRENIDAAIAEVRRAFEGGDYGYAALGNLLGDEQFANWIVNRVYSVSERNFRDAWTEITRAFEGKDMGYAALADLLRNDELARQIVAAADRIGPQTVSAAMGEIRRAFDGGDFGYAALGQLIGNDELANRIVNAAADFGATNVGKWVGATAPRDLLSTVSELPGLSVLNSTFGGIMDGVDGVNTAYANQRKAAEEVTKAEQALSEARGKDDKDAVTAAEQALATARDGVATAAVAAGHAEVALAIKAINLIWDMANHFVNAALRARSAVMEAFAANKAIMRELAVATEKQFFAVENLRYSVMNAVREQEAAARNIRIAHLDVARAQLAGALTVAQAEEALAAEREKVAKSARRDFDDLSGAYDRYRWAERNAMADRLRGVAEITPEIMALEHEVNAAKLLAAKQEREAVREQIKAVYAHRLAVIDAAALQRKLTAEQRRLAGLEATSNGMDSREALAIERLTSLMAENAKVQGERDALGSTIRNGLGRLLDWDGDGKMFFGAANNTWTAERKAYDDLIQKNKDAIREIMTSEFAPNLSPQEFRELEDVIDRAAAQFAMGNEAAGEALIRASKLGDASRAKATLDYQNQILDLERERDEAITGLERLRTQAEQDEALRPLEDTIKALEAGERSERYSADALRANSEAVRSANAALAEFEAKAARGYADSATGRDVTLTVELPNKKAYTREDVDVILNALNNVDGLAVRVERLEKGEPTTGELVDLMRYGA